MDQQTEVATHTINLLRVAEGQRQAAFDRLTELQSDLTSQLEKTDGLSQNRIAKLNALLKQTDESIAQGYADVKATHKDGLKQIAKLEGKQAVKMVNGQIGVPIVSAMIPEKQLEVIVDGKHIFGHSSGDWWDGQAEDLKTKFRGVVQQGVLLGQSVDEMTSKVRGTKAGNFEDGIMPAKKREAAALVRSAAISVANEARLRQYKEMGDVVKGIQWVSTLDTRTTPICRGLDGKMWRLPDYEPVGHDKAFPGPTAHWNCRSTQVAVLRSWDELSGKKLPSIADEELEDRMRELLKKAGAPQAKIDNVVANARASMDGQVKATTDFESWLRLQSDARVNQILGPGRAELWKTGKVTVSDMTDQTNRPLTIEQLEKVIETGTPAPETLGQQFLPMVSQSVPLTAKTTAELNKKASAEIESIVESADDETVEASPPDDSPATIAQILANPAGQTLKAKWIKKIQQANPDMEPKDVLANATQAAIVEQAAKSKASVLSGIKKKLTADQTKPLSPSEQTLYESLSPEELTSFLESVEQANKVKLLTKEVEEAAAANAKLQKAAAYQKVVQAAASADDDAISKIPKEEQDLLSGEDYGDALLEGEKIVKATAGKQKLLQDITAASAQGKSGMALLDPNDPIAQSITPEEFQKAYTAGNTVYENALTKAAILKDVTAQAAAGKLFDPDDMNQVVKLGGTKDEVVAAKAAGTAIFEATAKAKKIQQITDIVATGQDAPDSLKVGLKKQEILDATNAGFKIKAAILNAAPPSPVVQAVQAASQTFKPGNGKTKPVVTPATIPNPTSVPDPDSLTFVKTLPGSTSPSLMVDAAGKQWVVKEAKRVSAEHLKNEMLTDDIYRAAGVDVPMGQLIGGKKVTEFIEGAQTLGSLTGTLRDGANEALAKNFVLDALLGNWDVVGASADNVLFTAGKPVRIDNGGGLLYRAMGDKKLPSDLTPEIQELKTMRDKSKNAQTARVYGGLTKAEINDQIEDVLRKRDAILAVAAADPETLDLLTKRLDWLEGQRPKPKASPLTKQVARAAAAAIPADVAKILKRETTEGWVYDGDGDQIEDNRVHFWREKGGDLKPVLMSQAKLTEEGSAALRARLEASGFPAAGKLNPQTGMPTMPVSPGAKQAAQFQTILAAAKTINHHAAAGTPTKANPAKIQAAKDLTNELESAALQENNPAKRKHLMELLQMTGDVQAAHAKGQPVPKLAVPVPTPSDVTYWAAWIAPKAAKAGLKPPTNAPDYDTLYAFEATVDAAIAAKAKGPVSKAAPAGSGLDGWKIQKDDTWKPPQKNILPSGELTAKTGTVVSRDVGEYFTMTKDDVTVEFHPRKLRADGYKGTRDGRVNEGNVTVRIPGDAGPDTVQRALEAYADLGIPASPTTDTFRELLYIHRTVVQRNDHEIAAYKHLWEDKTLTEPEKLERIKTWAETQYRVKLPRGGRESWGDRYNPEGQAMGKDRVTGHKEFMRWDVTEAEMLKELKDHVFTHASGDPMELLKATIANGGIYTTTAERVRMGRELNTGGSPGSDINSGGATWLYTNLTDNKAGANARAGFVWGPELAMRQDLFSVNKDVYGKREAAPDRASLPKDLAKMRALGMRDSGLFKNGVSIFRNLRAFQVNYSRDIPEAIRLFKEAGIFEIDGKPIEDIVRVAK